MSVASLYASCFVMFYVFYVFVFYGESCHCSLKLDMSTLLTTISLNISLIYIRNVICNFNKVGFNTNYFVYFLIRTNSYTLIFEFLSKMSKLITANCTCLYDIVVW